MVKKKRIGWRMQDIREWIGSYLVILVIPIVVCSVFFLYTYLVIWEETRESNTAALQMVDSKLDQVFEEAFLLEYRIQSDRSVKEAAQIRQPLDANKRFALSKAAQEVSVYTGSYEWLGAWYVYFPNSDMVLTLGGAYIDRAVSYERIGKSCGYTQEEWEALLCGRNGRMFLKNEGSGPVAYISSLPVHSGTLRMNVILELNTGYLQNTLSYLDYMKNSGIVLTDEANRILVSRNLDMPDIGELSGQITAGNGYQNITVNGERMMASCMESQRIGLKVISLIPYREFWKKALQSLFSFLAALALCILVGTGAAYFFSVGKQRTWGKMKKIVSRKLAGNEDNLRFRNKEIAAAIENIVQEYDAMQKQLSAVDSMKKELLVTAALRGRIRPEDMDRVFEKNGVSYEIGNFMIILFQMERFDPFGDGEKGEHGSRDIESIRQAVTSVLQEVCEKEFVCETMNLDEKIVCIVDFGELDKAKCYEHIARLETLKDGDALGVSGVFETISISDVHRDIYFLHTAYSEAARVMEYQLVKGDGLILSYMEMLRKTQMSYLYSVENETALIRWICEGKKETAQELFEEIYEKNVANVNSSEDLRRCLMWNLTASVLRAESELRERAEFPDMQELLENMEPKIPLREAKEILKERIGIICDEAIKAKGKKGELVAEQVKEYIREHFSDPNLSNSQIAEVFRMNVSYLSTFYKEKTGQSPLAYIHWVRLENAKKLLDETNLTVEAISARVGCNNSVTLTRLFKKYEGMTPAEYKKRDRTQRKAPE